MLLMPIRNLDDIVCYEIGSDVAAPWEGTHCSLHGDVPALEIYARRGLIRLEINGDSVSISGATRVGLVILPSGRRLIIRSKISGLTILEWLAYLGEFRPLQRWLPEKGIAAKDTEQDDWYRCIGRLFLAAMEDVTRWHLRKDYAAIGIDEPQIRGRIMGTKLAQRIRHLPDIPQMRRSRTFDVPFNMILAKALDRVPALLVGGQTDDGKRMARLREQWSPIRRDIDDPIAAVTCAQWASPPGYRAALQLARLILIGAVVDPQSRMGGHALTLSLASVWERALRRMCDELAGTGWRRVSNAEHTRRWDDPAGRDDPTRWLNADVILKRLETRWVLDAKYKREFGNEGRTDRFQMCAYAIGFDANRVSLVYPIATTNGDSHRTILTATMGERVVQIDSIALPMSEGPQACLRRLARTMTIC
jgi:5-methylcytosine-specific restriction endonuclease McrBC regulatory subunit McrC